MAIDIRTRRPILSNNTGGLSGPAIRPIALRMISEVYRQVDIPIVGMGGIMTVEDVVAFMLAGASCVQVGTASLLHPHRLVELVDGLANYCREEGITEVTELTGALELW